MRDGILQDQHGGFSAGFSNVVFLLKNTSYFLTISEYRVEYPIMIPWALSWVGIANLDPIIVKL